MTCFSYLLLLFFLSMLNFVAVFWVWWVVTSIERREHQGCRALTSRRRAAGYNRQAPAAAQATPAYPRTPLRHLQPHLGSGLVKRSSLAPSNSRMSCASHQSTRGARIGRSNRVGCVGRRAGTGWCAGAFHGRQCLGSVRDRWGRRLCHLCPGEAPLGAAGRRKVARNGPWGHFRANLSFSVVRFPVSERPT